MERTPATSIRSLIGTGMPASWPRSATGFLHQPVGVLAGAVEAQGGQRVHGAVDRRDALFQCVEQIVRRHLAALEAPHDGHGILADQFIGHPNFP